MKRAKHFLWNFWSAESGLTALLVFTLAYLFAECALGDFSFSAMVGHLLFCLIIVSGVMTTFKMRWLNLVVVGLTLAGLILVWLEYVQPDWRLAILSAVFGLLLLGFLLATLIVQVFQSGAVTGHRIRGAIVVYLLLGGIWSFLYLIVAMVMPHAFHWPAGIDSGNRAAMQQALTYFSYVTLTTTGFGDIVPAIPLTRTLAMFEALAGQLFLVITLARLVSLALVSPNPGDSSKE